MSLKLFYLHFVREWKNKKNDVILRWTKEFLCLHYNKCLLNDKGDALVTVVIVEKTLAGGRLYQPINYGAVTCMFSGSPMDNIPLLRFKNLLAKLIFLFNNYSSSINDEIPRYKWIRKLFYGFVRKNKWMNELLQAVCRLGHAS